MSLSKTQTRAVSWRRTGPYALAAAIAGAANLVMIPWWLHLFGAAAYGRYAVTWTVAIACGSACVGWIRQSAMRAAGTGRGLGELPVWVVPVALVSTAVLTGTISTAIGVLRASDFLAAATMGAGLACAQLAATVVQRDDHVWRYASSEIARALVTIVATVVLGPGLDLPGERALLLAVAAGGFVVAAFLPKGGTRLTRPGALRRWWHYGWPLSAWLTLAPLVLYTDRLMLQIFASPALVGSFAALSDLMVRGSALLATPVVTSGSVWAMREFNLGRRRDVLHEMRLLTMLGLGVSAVVALAALLLHTWISDVVGLGELPIACFPLLALGGTLWQAGSFAHKPLELARRTRAMLLELVLAVVLVASISLVLVPNHGALGAAIALVVGVSAYVVATLATASQIPPREA